MKNIFKCLMAIMIISIIVCAGMVFASENEEEIPTEINNTLTDITRVLSAIAGIVCLFKLIQIGIMYMLTGANEKSTAKTAVLPWIIGAVVCGGYSIIGGAVIDMIRENSGGVLDPGDVGEKVNTIGNSALSIIAIVAGAVAVGMVIYIGIRYMLSGAQGMAKVKTTLMPWLIGALIIASASAITNVVMGIVGGGEQTETGWNNLEDPQQYVYVLK